MLTLKNLFRKGKTESAAHGPDNLLEDYLVSQLMGIASSAGIDVTPLKILGVSTVFSCVSVITRAVSTLPLKIYEKQNGSARREATEHRLYDILHSIPNEEMTSVDFRSAMQSHLTLRNQSFAIIRRDGMGRVYDMWPVLNCDIQPFRKKSTKELMYYHDGFDYKASDILHLKGLTMNGVKGLDPTSTCKDVFALALALDENAAKFFANSSRPGLTIEAPGALSDEVINRLRKQIDEKHNGAENAYRTLILEAGMKAANSRSENRDSQFDESRDRQDKAIARIFGVPPHKVGIMGDATFSNIEQQNIEFVTDVLCPIVTVWEQAMMHKLLTPAERKKYFISMNVDGLLRGDIATRFEAYHKAFQDGIFSVNEIRALENRNPVEGGDQHFRPLNLVPLNSPTTQNEA